MGAADRLELEVLHGETWWPAAILSRRQDDDGSHRVLVRFSANGRPQTTWKGPTQVRLPAAPSEAASRGAAASPGRHRAASDEDCNQEQTDWPTSRLPLRSIAVPAPRDRHQTSALSW